MELDVSADALVLELSEACLSLPNINLTERMTALSKLGVQLHIENFGAGFTSLKHLAKLDVSAIKVAGFFNERLSMSRASESMVSAILAFAYQLDLERLAAGVTSAEQLSFLHSHQCHYARVPILANRFCWMTWKILLTILLKASRTWTKPTRLRTICHDIKI